MARPKNKDPKVSVTVTLPRSIRQEAQAKADEGYQSFSAFVAKVLRDFFRRP